MPVLSRPDSRGVAALASQFPGWADASFSRQQVKEILGYESLHGASRFLKRLEKSAVAEQVTLGGRGRGHAGVWIIKFKIESPMVTHGKMDPPVHLEMNSQDHFQKVVPFSPGKMHPEAPLLSSVPLSVPEDGSLTKAGRQAGTGVPPGTNACLPAGEKTGTAKTDLLGLTPVEKSCLDEAGVLGSWFDSPLHEREVALKAITELPGKEHQLNPSSAEALVANGRLTAKGVWAAVKTLGQTRTSGGQTSPICIFATYLLKKWSKGNFINKDGIQDGFVSDFLALAEAFHRLGWYEIPQNCQTKVQRTAQVEIQKFQAVGMPPTQEMLAVAASALEEAQKAWEASRPVVRTLQIFLGSEDGRRLGKQLLVALEDRRLKEHLAGEAARVARLAKRVRSPEELALGKIASTASDLVSELTAEIGILRLPVDGTRQGPGDLVIPGESRYWGVLWKELKKSFPTDPQGESH